MLRLRARMRASSSHTAPTVEQENADKAAAPQYDLHALPGVHLRRFPVMASRSSFPALRASPVNVVPAPAVAGGCKPSAASHLPSRQRHTASPHAASAAAKSRRAAMATITTVRYQPRVCRLKIVSDSVLPLQVWGIGRTQVCQQDTGFSLTHYRLLSIQLVDNCSGKVRKKN